MKGVSVLGFNIYTQLQMAFVREAGKHIGWQKRDRGFGWLLASGGFERNEDMGGRGALDSDTPRSMERLSRPFGGWKFQFIQTQGGARSSLALGWLVKGRWLGDDEH